MPRLLSVALCLLCALSITGCTRASAASLDGIPENAELVYTYTSIDVFGHGITTDVWNNQNDTGFFVLEVLCNGGGIGQLEIQSTAGKVVSSFESVQQNGIFITDIVTEAAGEYTLYFGEADHFNGEINMYFVPGIGFHLAD